MTAIGGWGIKQGAAGNGSPENGDPWVARIAAVVAILLILSSAIFFAPADLIVADERMGFVNPLKPSYIYFLTYGATAYLVMTRRFGLIPLGSVKILGSLVVLACLHLAWMPFVVDDDEIARTLVLRLNDIVMTFSFFLIFSSLTNFGLILGMVRLVTIATCILNVVVVVFSDQMPIPMAVFPGRAAGLFWDPNQCATFLAMSLPLICFRMATLPRVVLYLIILVGILFTFSREGLVLWALAVPLDLILRPGLVGLDTSKVLRSQMILTFSVAVLGISFSVLFPILFDALTPFLNADTMARLNGIDQGSANQRLQLVDIGLQMFVDAPFFGSGYGSTRLLSIGLSLHNMYLLMMVEFGLVGLAIYVYFLSSLFTIKARFGAIAGILFVVESLFTHSYFDNCYYGLLIVLYWRLAGGAEGRMPNAAGKEGGTVGGSTKGY